MRAGPLTTPASELLDNSGTSCHDPNHARAVVGSALWTRASGNRSELASIELMRASTRTASITILNPFAANPKRRR